MYIYVCVYICIYVCIYIYILFIKACPITLGNTTCRINLFALQEASFGVSLYIVQNFYDASFVIIYICIYVFICA